MRITVVENDAVQHELAVALLDGCGAEVSAFDDAPRAAAWIRATRPRVVVADLDLPDPGAALVRAVVDVGARGVALTAPRVPTRETVYAKSFEIYLDPLLRPSTLWDAVAAVSR